MLYVWNNSRYSFLINYNSFLWVCQISLSYFVKKLYETAKLFGCKNKNGEFAQKKEEKRTKSRKKTKRPFTKFSKCVIITGYCD